MHLATKHLSEAEQYQVAYLESIRECDHIVFNYRDLKEEAQDRMRRSSFLAEAWHWLRVILYLEHRATLHNWSI